MLPPIPRAAARLRVREVRQGIVGCNRLTLARLLTFMMHMATKALLIAGLALASSAPHLTAAEATPEGQQAADAHNLIWKHSLFGTKQVYDAHGAAVRAAAVLEACGLKGLAQTVEPSDDAVVDFVMEYVMSEPDAKARAFELIASIKSSMFYYRIGYLEAVKTTLSMVGKAERAAICEAATNSANKLLSEQKSAAEPNTDGK